MEHGCEGWWRCRFLHDPLHRYCFYGKRGVCFVRHSDLSHPVLPGAIWTAEQLPITLIVMFMSLVNSLRLMDEATRGRVPLRCEPLSWRYVVLLKLRSLAMLRTAMLSSPPSGAGQTGAQVRPALSEMMARLLVGLPPGGAWSSTAKAGVFQIALCMKPETAMWSSQGSVTR
jgi:hypothetical protein